jgi:hypothetical protein
MTEHISDKINMGKIWIGQYRIISAQAEPAGSGNNEKNSRQRQDKTAEKQLRNGRRRQDEILGWSDSDVMMAA